MKKILIGCLGMGLLAAIIVAALWMIVPDLGERITMQVYHWRSAIHYRLNPPEAEVFVPQPMVEEMVAATLTAQAPAPAETVAPTATVTIQATPTLAATRMPLPGAVRLKGAVHEFQKWNNCGPATLSTNLTFWGWQGDQRDTANWIKPNPRDKNTSPQELVAYVEAETDLRAILRYGGDLETLKYLLMAGFPVIIERGFDGYDNEGWMGHYQLLSGYDDSWQRFISQDVLIMPDFPVPYAEVENYWQDFNNVFIVIYSPEREEDLMRTLGPLADAATSLQIALARADVDVKTLQGRDLFFAWFNLGTTLVEMKDYQAAADAYDQAFTLYAQLPEEERPWRMMWYQHGPYVAYDALGRSSDVINLATQTISFSIEPALEESFYWRGRAKAALSDAAGAAEDLREALKWHPGWNPANDELTLLGVSP